MTDQELLERAAKAAGITGVKWIGLGLASMIDPSQPESTGTVGAIWNPLFDSAQALDLAVTLRLTIDHNHPGDQQRYVVAERRGCEGCFDPVCCVEDEFEEVRRSTATRMAIRPRSRIPGRFARGFARGAG